MVGIRDVISSYFRVDPEKAVQELRRSSLNKGNILGRIGFKRGANKEHGSDVDLVVMDASNWGRKVGDHYQIMVHGKKLQLCNDPCYIFRADQPTPNKLRRIAVWISEWHWFEVCITAAIFANCIIMALPSSYNPDSATDEEKTIFTLVNVVCLILFSAECVLKIVARGLFVGDAPDACYFQSVTNWFDFIVLLISYIEMTSDDSSKFILLRTFRVLRPLRTIEKLPVLKMIVSTLTDSIPRLIHWFLTVVFICCLYAILGISLFGTVYWHRCRLTEAPITVNGKVEWPIDPAQTRFCGGRYTCKPTASGAPTFCGSVVDSVDGTYSGIDPWPEVDDQAIADYGFSGFQTFLGALTTIFQVATMEGWSEVMYRFQDGRGDVLALLYFISLLLFGGLLLFRLEVAILWQSFESKMRLRLEIHDEEIPANIMSMKIEELASKVHVLEAAHKANTIYEQMDKSTGAFSTIRSICLSLVGTPTFDGVILTVIAMNCLVLGCDAYPQPDDLILKLTDQVNVICTIVFTLEAVLRIVSFGFKYFEDYFNIFDLSLVIVSLVEIVIGGSATVSALRVSRLLRLFKVFGQSVPMRVLYRVFRRATVLTCNFALIVILVLLGWTLVALHLFHEDSNEGDKQIQITNFLWAFIAMFQLLCGDRWHEMMVEHAHGSKELGTKVGFFVAVFTTCHLILMNLFLGMFVAAFAVAREEVVHEYRFRMLQFTMAAQASSPAKSESKARPSIPKKEEPEPSWPHGAVRLRDMAKTGTPDMNVLKMFHIKLKAAKRATRKGEQVLLRDTMPSGHLSIEQVRNSPAGNGASGKEPSRVSFHHLTIDIPPDDEVAGMSSAMLMSVPLHQSMPPPLPDIIEHLPQSKPPTLAAFDLTDASTACDLLVVPGCAVGGQPSVPTNTSNNSRSLDATPASLVCKKRLEQSFPQPYNQERGSEHKLITLPRLPQLGQHGLTLIDLPRMGVQGRSTEQRYTSILGGSRSGSKSSSLDEVAGEPDSGLRCRRPVEVRATPDVREVQAPPTLNFKEAYRKQRASARGEHEPSMNFSKLREQLRLGISGACSEVVRVPPVSVHSHPRACRQPEVHASAENLTSVRSVLNSPTKLRLPVGDDAHEISGNEICLPVRDNSRESCGSDQEVPPLGHLLVPVANHSAPPALDQAEEEHKEHLVHEIGPVAMLCQKLVHQTWFDPCILALIAISSLCLAIETPYMNKDSSLASVLEILDYIISAAFFCEMVAKIGAFGLWQPMPNETEPAYLRSGWNWLDGIVVLSSIMDFASRLFSSSGTFFKILRAIRLMRAMRPLRLVQRNKGIKLLVECLIMSTPTLLRCLVITGLLYVGFAILFMNLLKGQLWRCSLDPTGELRPDIVTRADCTAAGGTWINARSHFDQIGNSFAAVVHIGTGEGWVEVLQNMVNSVGIDRQPRKNAREEFAFLMIAFVALSNFFLVNLFIGVLIDQYCVVSDIMAGMELSDQAEKQFVAVQQQIFGMHDLLRPAFRIEGYMKERRMKLASIIQTRCFEAFLFVCIIANSILMCVMHPTMSDGLKQTVDVFSTIFIVIFNIEAVMKLFVYKADYFKDSWNVFDLTITVGADASLITSWSAEGDVVEVLHAFRVVRVLRCIRYFTAIRRQCTALLALVPATLNIGILIVLLLFMYACLGVGLFGTIAPGETLNDQANFKSFGMAFLTTVRILTGEKWHDLMYDLVSDRPDCTNDLQNSEELDRDGPRGCGTVLAYPFFVSFTSFVSIVMLNLIVAVVLQGYQSVELSLNLEVYTDQVKQLAAKWREYDTAMTGFLHLDYATVVLTKISVPIGFKGWSAHRVRHMLRELPLYDERVHIRDVLTVCVKRIYCWLNHCREHDAVKVKLNKDVVERWYALYPGLPHPDTSVKSFFVAHAIIKRRIELHLQRSRRARAYRAQQDVIKEDENMQLQAKSKGAKAAAELMNVENVEMLEKGRKTLNGLNAAGLPLQMPGGDLQGASAEASEQRTPVSVEALTAGFSRSSSVGLRKSAAPLPWPPPMPHHLERQAEGDPPQFAPCQLVGSGFDTVTTTVSHGS